MVSHPRWPVMAFGKLFGWEFPHLCIHQLEESSDDPLGEENVPGFECRCSYRRTDLGNLRLI